MMISVVDKYYRRIAQNIDNVTMKFDISNLLVNLKNMILKLKIFLILILNLIQKLKT